MTFRPLLGLALLAAAPLTPAADWPNWRGPTRDGISTETGWKLASGAAKQLWTAQVGMGCSAVHVSNGRAYTQGNKNETDTIYCFDAVTGKEIWKHSYPCPLQPKFWEGGTLATPTVDGDRVYALSKTGDLFCFEAATGKIVWQKHLEKDFGGKMPTWGFAGSPLILKDQLLLDTGAPGGSVVALAKATGKLVWKNGSDQAGYSTLQPFSRAGKDYLANFNGVALVVLEQKGGKEVGRYPFKTKYDVNAVTPIISGDKLFIAAGYNHGSALVRFTGSALEKVWENNQMKNHFNSCVLVDGFLYGFDENNLACMELATGNLKWTQTGIGKASLMLADGKLIILAEKGDLIIATPSPESFKETARAKVLGGKCWCVPVLANGRLYAKNNAGDLVCLDLSGK
jgi:outer membrane protein assembly factor BamB